MYVRQHFERYLTEAEERALFSHVAQFGEVLARRDAAWMGFMRQTGIRVTPMSLFSVSDARQALSSGDVAVRGVTTKRGRGYSVKANKKALQHLRTLLAVRTEMGYRGGSPDEPLVMSRNHQPMSVRSYQDRFKHWLQGAGVNTNASPHWLRHTLSKRILQHSTSVNPLRIVQVALGHSSLASTAVYTMPDKEEIAASMEAAS